MQLSSVMSWSGAPTKSIISTLAFYGIFVSKEMENDSLGFNEMIFEGSVRERVIGGYGLKKADYNRILKRLQSVNGLKDEHEFMSKKGQNDLRKSLKYTILMKLCNSNFFGAKATQHIGSELCYSDKEYQACIGTGEYFFIPRMSESQASLQAIGYSRFIKKYLDVKTFNEVLDQFKAACETVRPDFIDSEFFNGGLEDIMDSCARFSDLFRKSQNLHNLYPLKDTENEICKHVWFLDVE